MSKVYCTMAANALTASVLSESPLPWPWNSHLESCLRCQAHLASVKATRRRLNEMRTEGIGTPAELVDRVSLAMELHPAGGAIGPRFGRRAAATSAALAAVALAAAWMWRRAQDRSVELWT
jgi:hypothetical protein